MCTVEEAEKRTPRRRRRSSSTGSSGSFCSTSSSTRIVIEGPPRCSDSRRQEVQPSLGSVPRLGWVPPGLMAPGGNFPAECRAVGTARSVFGKRIPLVRRRRQIPGCSPLRGACVRARGLRRPRGRDIAGLRYASLPTVPWYRVPYQIRYSPNDGDESGRSFPTVSIGAFGSGPSLVLGRRRSGLLVHAPQTHGVREGPDVVLPGAPSRAVYRFLSARYSIICVPRS